MFLKFQMRATKGSRDTFNSRRRTSPISGPDDGSRVHPQRHLPAHSRSPPYRKWKATSVPLAYPDQSQDGQRSRDKNTVPKSALSFYRVLKGRNKRSHSSYIVNKNKKKRYRTSQKQPGGMFPTLPVLRSETTRKYKSFFPSRWARGRRLERRSDVGEATAAARRVPPHVRQSPPRFLQSPTRRAAGRPHTTTLPGGSSRAGVVDTLFPVPPSEQHARRRDAEVCHRTARPGRQPLARAARPSLAVGQGIG